MQIHLYSPRIHSKKDFLKHLARCYTRERISEEKTQALQGSRVDKASETTRRGLQWRHKYSLFPKESVESQGGGKRTDHSMKL